LPGRHHEVKEEMRHRALKIARQLALKITDFSAANV
jgi:hypothetical protein